MKNYLFALLAVAVLASPLHAAEKKRKPSAVEQGAETTSCFYFNGSGLVVAGGTLIRSECTTVYNAGCRDGGGQGNCQSGPNPVAGKDCCHCEKQ
jgi:hypothetical protein